MHDNNLGLFSHVPAEPEPYAIAADAPQPVVDELCERILGHARGAVEIDDVVLLDLCTAAVRRQGERLR
ncbi:hypothetical protein [Nocardia sp. NPDC051750]|uniref:hypothetical protein n=1 Tax=Nocardia sp. NPDC051750 TaxID=3364325 RepID=UPI00379DBA40